MVKKTTKVLIKESNGNFPRKSSQKKFSIIKKKFDINFNKAPFKDLREKIEKYFNDPTSIDCPVPFSKRKRFYGFNWTRFLQEYEKVNLEIKLKRSRNNGKFEDYSISINDTNKLIMFVKSSNIIDLKKMKEIFKIKNKTFEFIPIYGHRVKGKLEASNII